MIKINLLPQDMGVKGGGAPRAPGEGSGKAIVVLVLVLLFGANLFFAGYVVYTRAQEVQRTARKESDLQSLSKQLTTQQAEYNKVKKEIDHLKEMLTVLNTLDPEDRLLWSKKLNVLPTLLPDGVFLDRIKVVEDVKEVETKQSAKAFAEWSKTKKGTPPARIKKPVIKQRLDLFGVAYAPGEATDQRLKLITTFYRNIESKSVELPYNGEKVAFLDNFDPKINLYPIEQGTAGGRTVSKFHFAITSKQITAPDPEGPAPAKPAAKGATGAAPRPPANPRNSTKPR